MTEGPYFINNLQHGEIGSDRATISWSNPNLDPPSTGQVLY
jgi:hypothetical protein